MISARPRRLHVLRGHRYQTQLVTCPGAPGEGGAWDPRQPQLVVNGSGRGQSGPAEHGRPCAAGPYPLQSLILESDRYTQT